MRTVAPVLHPIKGVTQPWTVIGVDLIGPLPTTQDGYKYALTMTDLFTKWVVAEPLRTKHGAEAATCIINKFFEFGIPKKVITDQGREFVNEANTAIFKVLKVKHCMTLAYHPQTNGQDERTNQTLKRQLAKYVNDTQDDWDDHLKSVVCSINNSKQASTKYTPFFLMFNRHPNMPEVLNTDPMGEDFAVGDPEDNIDAKIVQVAALRAEVFDGSSRQIRVYDSKGWHKQIPTGDLDLLCNAFKDTWDLRNWTVSYPSQWLQTDSQNCGVFVCTPSFGLPSLYSISVQVMYACTLLLCYLTGQLLGVDGGGDCQLMVKSLSGNVYQAGDVVIGGLFPVHMEAPHPEMEFKRKKVNDSCKIFNQRAYRWLQTMIFAVQEINSNPGLLPNLSLGYLTADTCLEESTTLVAAMTMVTGQDVSLADTDCGSAPTVPVIIGDARSSGSIVVADTLGVFDIPMVSYFASCVCLSDSWKYPLFFRTMPSDAEEAQAMAKLLRLLGWTWVGLVSADDDFGRFGSQMLMEALRGTEVCVAYHEVIPKALFQEVAHQNITDKQWIANDAWVTLGIGKSLYADISQLRITYNVYKGVYAIAHALHDMLACQPGKGPFLNGQCPDVRRLQPAQIHHYLRRVNFTTPLGERIYFDQNGDPPASYYIINWHVAEGTIQFVHVGHFVSYQGSSGQFHIDMDRVVWGGGNRHMVPVSVCSSPCPPGTRKAVQKGRPVCCFDCLPCAEGVVSNEIGSLECVRCPERFWSNSNHTVCVAQQVDFLSYNDSMGMILSIISVAGATLTAATSSTFLYYRHTPFVRANNSEVSFMLLLSLKLCFLCALAFIGQPAVLSCMLRHTLFGISFVTCISCLLSRTVVVLVAFRSTLPGKNLMRYVGPTQQRLGICICTLVQGLICMLWLTLAPPQPAERAIQENQRPKIILECAIGSVVAFSLVLGFIGLLACLCLFLAFLARKLPDNFNEAKLITFSMLIFCAVWVAFVPAYISSPGKYSVAVEIFAILASSYGLLLCIFAPKCYIILLRPEKNNKKHLMTR
ncbi:vomeronasal type-2 receptor 1-like [Diretmus argenteus]